MRVNAWAWLYIAFLLTDVVFLVLHVRSKEPTSDIILLGGGAVVAAGLVAWELFRTANDTGPLPDLDLEQR